MFTLPKLNFDFDALLPHIDAKTMEIHHGKHHAAYVDNLNKALPDFLYQNVELETILAKVLPNETAIRNNAGGHFNHSLFWESLSPNPGKISSDLQTKIEATFESMDNFKVVFETAAKSRFGSGWAWLIVCPNGDLKITSTANQDNPLMLQIVPDIEQGTPILGLDVWEHAYYLNYQNRRADYIAAWWNILDWDKVSQIYSATDSR